MSATIEDPDEGWHQILLEKLEQARQSLIAEGERQERERWQREDYPSAVQKGGEDMLEHVCGVAEEMAGERHILALGDAAARVQLANVINSDMLAGWDLALRELTYRLGREEG